MCNFTDTSGIENNTDSNSILDMESLGYALSLTATGLFLVQCIILGIAMIYKKIREKCRNIVITFLMIFCIIMFCIIFISIDLFACKNNFDKDFITGIILLSVSLLLLIISIILIFCCDGDAEKNKEQQWISTVHFDTSYDSDSDIL